MTDDLFGNQKRKLSKRVLERIENIGEPHTYESTDNRPLSQKITQELLVGATSAMILFGAYTLAPSHKSKASELESQKQEFKIPNPLRGVADTLTDWDWVKKDPETGRIIQDPIKEEPITQTFEIPEDIYVPETTGRPEVITQEDLEAVKEKIAITFREELNERTKEYYQAFKDSRDIRGRIGNTRKYVKYIEASAKENDLDPYLVFATIMNESMGKPRLVSHRGAAGLMQIMPDTADWLTKKSGLKCYKRFDPETNIKCGCHQLNWLMYDVFDDEDTALAGYNAGHGRMRRALKKNNAETFWDLEKGKIPNEAYRYVPKILAMKRIVEEREEGLFN